MTERETKMIKTSYKTDYAELNERFYNEIGRWMPGFDWQEQDAYTGELTLGDNEELDGRGTTLYVGEDGYSVAVYDEDGECMHEENHGELAGALWAYESLTVEFNTNATRIVM